MAAPQSRLIEALTRAAGARGEVVGLWLEGSFGRGEADAFSDVDAYFAVADDEADAFWAGRAAFLASVGDVLIVNDAAIPGLRCMHALFADGERLDLFVEAISKALERPRPPFQLLVDKAGLAARLARGSEAAAGAIGPALLRSIRFTRQGGAWPCRLLGRGQWSTFAMMELDLVNAQLTQLFAVQIAPELFFQHPFALARRLPAPVIARLDALTGRVLAATAAKDLRAALGTHLEVYDALVQEGRAACGAAGVAYPIAEEVDSTIRRLIERGWPSRASRPE